MVYIPNTLNIVMSGCCLYLLCVLLDVYLIFEKLFIFHSCILTISFVIISSWNFIFCALKQSIILMMGIER